MKEEINVNSVHIIERAQVEFASQNAGREEEINIIVADNMYNTAFTLAADFENEKVIGNENWLNSLNGTMLLPQNMTDAYTVLLNGQYVNQFSETEFPDYLTTIAHEMTHVYDHSDYAKYKKIDSFSKLAYLNDYDLFFQWTEFHARWQGSLFFRKKIYNLNNIDRLCKESLAEQELEMYWKRYIIEYSQRTEPWRRNYSTMQWLGRVKMWKDVCPEMLNLTFLQKLFRGNQRLVELFMFLDEHDTFVKVSDELLQLRAFMDTQ